jgi:preprotein translocase subunit YajC
MNSMFALQMVALLAVFYFFIMRPSQTKAKKEKEFESGLKVGDKIITKSGFHGKIAEIGETTVVIETMSGKLKIERSAISLDLTIALNKKA